MTMIAAILPILAAALTAPDVEGAFILRLDPGESSASRDGGALMVEIFVAPDRTVEGCRVISSSYSEEGNQRVCDRARTMRAAKAAKDLEGNPVHGFVTLDRVTWAGSRAPEAPTYTEPAYLEVSVLDLPGRDTRRSVYVLALVDREGTLLHCERADRQDRELAVVACQQAGGQSLPIMRDRSGAPITYVRPLKVDFTEHSSAP